MKIANLFLITALVGVLSVLGCDSSTSGEAGSGGNGGTAGSAGDGGSGGTAGDGGSGGSDMTCDTAAEVCANCDAPMAAPACETAYDVCLADPPNIEVCDSCRVIGLQACGI